MAKNLGTFTFAANFQVKAAEALDPRMVAASKADLINKANWPADGDTIYVYKGLIVDCGADGVYRLVDPAKALEADYSGWERIDAGAISFDGIFSYAGSVENYEALPANPNKGDVYNVESAFSVSITLPAEGELEGEVITKEYPAGTNVAWNGEAWDALAGSIDLSGYATKVEVSEIRTNVATNTQNITNLSTALGETNEEVAKKVDAEEGKALVDVEKIALIDTNATDIVNLKAADVTLEGKISAVEGAISDSSKGLDALSNRIDGHNTRLEALESDNTTNKTNIGTLQTDVTGHGTRLAAAESSITSNTTNISALTTQVGEHGTSISNLNTSVQNNATEIANAKASINGVDQRVATIEADYLKAADITGKLDVSVYEAKVAELVQADADNLAAAKKYADDLKTSIDSAYAAADTQVLTDAKAYADSLVYDDSKVKEDIKANADAIAVLNGTDSVEGSVAKQVKDAINSFAEEVTDNNTIDTFKELIDYAATHGSEFSTLAGTVQSNATAIATLNGTAEEAGSVAKAVKDAVDAEAAIARGAEKANADAIKAIADDYLKAADKTELSNAIAAEKSRAEGVESNLEARLAAVEGDYLKSADKTELQTAIDNKVAQSDYDVKIAALEKADADNLAAAKTYADSLLEWEEVE